MRSYILFAVLAGTFWGVGGYFEKNGLKSLGLPPVAGIALRTAVALVVLGLISIPAWQQIQRPESMKGWLMILIGGGIVAGSLGMWSFYAALSHSQNLGITLAVAFAFSPIAGTVTGLIKRDQPVDARSLVGMLLIVSGIVLVQLSRPPAG